MEAARPLALETGVASVTLTAVASRAGVDQSAARRYFTSHKEVTSHREVLTHLAAEGWVRWSNRVRGVARARCDVAIAGLLANLHLHLDHEVDLSHPRLPDS